MGFLRDHQIDELHPEDPWATTSNGYDPKHLYIRSKVQGQYETVTLRIPSGVYAAAARAVDMVADYRNVSDVLRDGLVHRLVQIDSWPDTDLRFRELRHELLLHWLEDREEDIRGWETTIAQTRSSGHHLIEVGMLESAEHLLLEADENSMDMPDSFQDQMAEVLKNLRVELSVAQERKRAETERWRRRVREEGYNVVSLPNRNGDGA